MRVNREDEQKGVEFTKVLSRWQDEEWVKFLYTHGDIVEVDTYKEAETWTILYVVKWKLKDNKFKTLFLLKHSDVLDKVYE